MSGHRQDRMAIEIKRSLSQIMHEQVKDPRIDFSKVSITRVDVSQDISHARINISILGDENQQLETMKALNKARGFIKSEMAREFSVKHFPELEFRLDKSIEHGLRISSLLQEINQEQHDKSTHE